MKIALAQLNYHIGNFEFNTQKIIQAIQEAKAKQAEIVLFGELAVCGYPARDFLEFDDFIERCQQSLQEIKEHTSDIAIVIGCPTKNNKKEGKDLYNSAYFIADKKVIHITHKTLLPTYDVFDEYRYFQPNDIFECVYYKGKKIAVTICEDIWNVGNENPMYPICPMDYLIQQSPDFILNLSASPFNYTHPSLRNHTIKSNVEAYNIPLFYCNNVGAQTELIFDGGSMVYDAQGNCCGLLPHFTEAIEVFDSAHLVVQKLPDYTNKKYELIHDALVLGIKDYFQKMGFKKAILGLSGGVDSALTLCLAVEALGSENVMSVLLPSQYSSDHSVADSIALVKNLQSPHEIIPIKEAYDSFEKTLSHLFEGLSPNVTEENIQARCRAVILMAMSNKFGYILLNTTNKSEAAVGYGTLYGDMCGGIAVLGDVYKTEVYEICNYINRNKEIIPTNILTKAPSAELRPGQKDSDSLPAYDLLDSLLYQYIEKRQGPNELIAQGFDKTLIERVLKMVNSNEWKRYQTPPILRVSPCAFGMGRRMPIVGKYLS
ncbi:MAG: NAD+ synthase [Bacteroidota bacterium]